MPYNELTAEQKAILDSWMVLFRGISGELARLNNHIDAVKTSYTGNIGEILTLLASDDIIPNTGNLDGAESMTKAEVLTIAGYLITAFELNTNTHRENIAKAAGPRNLIG